MAPLADILDALSRPLRALVDPGERIYWAFLVSSIAMPWLVIGWRRGTLALWHGLLRPRGWVSASSRADVTLIFVKALGGVLWRVPWATATAGAALGVGLHLHGGLGPAPRLEWGPVTIGVVYTVVLFVGWDLSRWLLHWAMHRVRWLWAFHQVHHSARRLTPLTLYRTHPVETLAYELRGLVTTALITGVFVWAFPGRAVAYELLGINAIGFVFNLAGANLRHSHVWLGFGRLERWLLSPAQHQVHHARDMSMQTSNYGTWIAAWDRWAGSWRPSPEQAPREYGLDEANHRHDRVGSMLVGPFVELARRGRGAWLAGVVVLVPRSVSAAAGPPAEDPPAPTDVVTPPPSMPDVAIPSVPPPEPEPAPAPVPAPMPSVPGAGVPVPVPAEPVPAPEPEPAAPEVDAAASDGDGDGADEDEDEDADEETDGTETVREVVVGSLFEEEELPRVAGSAHVVSEAELERREHDDVHKVLATVPGVYVRGEDGFGLRPNIGLRGANPDRSAKVTLLEDGILLGPAPYSAPAAYYFPLTTRMVGLEVFKGPASIRHGPNTIGGAINLRTREIPDDHTSVVDLAGGRFGYYKGHGFYGTTYRGFGVLLEAARVQTSGFKKLDTGGGTGYAKNDTMLKLGYESPAGRTTVHDIEIKGGFASEQSNETYLGISQADFDVTPYRRYAASDGDNMKWWRSQAEVSYIVRHDDPIEFETRLYRHDFHRVWRRLDSFDGGPALTDVLADPDSGQSAVFAAILRGEQDSLLPQHTLLVTNNDRRFVSEGSQSVFRWKPKWQVVSQHLEIGARLHHDYIDRHHTEDGFLMTTGVMVPSGMPRMDSVVNRAEALAAAFHFYDAITLFDRLTIAPGVRVEIISMRFSDGLADTQARRLDMPVTPGIGVHVAATDWLGVFGGVHRGFSPVSPGQPEQVRPEFSINYEAGARAAFRGLSAEVVGFVSDYDNLNGACTFSAGCAMGDGSMQFNAGRVLVWGTESLARYRHRFAKGLAFEVGANYTYTGSRFREAFTSAFPQWGTVEAGDQLPYVPNHLVGGTVAVGGRIWDVHVSPAYTSAMRDLAGQGSIPGPERIPGFFLLDLGTEVRVLERFRIYGQIGNVTNTTYIASRRPFGIRPGAPLAFMIGVKAHIL